MPTIPDEFHDLLKPIFAHTPLSKAMPRLTGEAAADPQLDQLVRQVLADPQLAGHPGIRAGLLLYIDQLDESHTVSQGTDNPTGSYWHAIMHRREPDFSNAKYWYRKVGNHPAMSRIDQAGGGAGAGTEVGAYDPYAFVDAVEAASGNDPSDHPELVSLQRHEWKAVFEYCLEN
jgi:hypothetical protein